MLKTARFRSRARQPKSFTCIKFHSATTGREEKKEVLGRKAGRFFCRLATTQNHQKNAHVHLCVASRIERNQSACVGEILGFRGFEDDGEVISSDIDSGCSDIPKRKWFEGYVTVKSKTCSTFLAPHLMLFTFICFEC